MVPVIVSLQEFKVTRLEGDELCAKFEQQNLVFKGCILPASLQQTFKKVPPNFSACLHFTTFIFR